MKLYTKIIYTLAAVFAAISISSCDKISDDDRFIELPAIEAKRVVLLEEYTGQKCVNCPTAHSVIVDLLSTLSDNLVAVSIHGGGDAFSYHESKYPFGLANDDSQAYCDESGVTSLPAGVVNRNSGVQNYDQWAATIRKEMEKTTDIDLSVEATISDDGKSIDIVSTILPYNTMSPNYQIWIVESGIISMQLTPNGRVSNYEHNHVFRAAVNGHKGEEVKLTTRETYCLNHSIAINERWNPENLAVVAFVYDNNGVKQAAQCHVKAQSSSTEE